MNNWLKAKVVMLIRNIINQKAADNSSRVRGSDSGSSCEIVKLYLKVYVECGIFVYKYFMFLWENCHWVSFYATLGCYSVLSTLLIVHHFYSWITVWSLLWSIMTLKPLLRPRLRTTSTTEARFFPESLFIKAKIRWFLFNKNYRKLYNK